MSPNCLEFQCIESKDDVPEIHRRSSDNIILDDEFDEQAIEKNLDMIIDDVRRDPEWFTFDNE